MFSRYLIQRDFHDILHKFQSLGGAEASAEQDELEIKLQGGDLKEAGNGGIDNTNVDVENAVGDFEETEGNRLLARTEVSIPAEYDEIVVVEHSWDDEADEAGAAGEEPFPEEYQPVGRDHEKDSTENIINMVDENNKEGSEEGEVIKEVEECENGKEEEGEGEEDTKKEDDGKKKGREEKTTEEQNIKEQEVGEKGKDEGGENGDVEIQSGWRSPLGELAEQMFRNEEEMERAVDQTDSLKESNKTSKKVEKKKVSMQQLVRAFSAVRNLKKIFR